MTTLRYCTNTKSSLSYFVNVAKRVERCDIVAVSHGHSYGYLHVE